MTTTAWPTSPCRSCSAPVIWAVTPNGRRQPIDAEPHEAGIVHLRPSQADPAVPLAVVCTDEEIRRQLHRDEHALFHKPHHATCPDGPAWQRKPSKEKR